MILTVRHVYCMENDKSTTLSSVALCTLVALEMLGLEVIVSGPQGITLWNPGAVLCSRPPGNYSLILGRTDHECNQNAFSLSISIDRH